MRHQVSSAVTLGTTVRESTRGGSGRPACAGLDFLKKKILPAPVLKASLQTLILVGKTLFDHGSLQALPETTIQKTNQNNIR